MSGRTPMELMTEKYERAQRHIAELKKLIQDMESGQMDLENPVRAGFDPHLSDPPALRQFAHGAQVLKWAAKPIRGEWK